MSDLRSNPPPLCAVHGLQMSLFPVAIIFDDPDIGWRAFAEVAIFLLILSLAIVHAWRKGVIKWDR